MYPAAGPKTSPPSPTRRYNGVIAARAERRRGGMGESSSRPAECSDGTVAGGFAAGPAKRLQSRTATVRAAIR